MYMRLSRPHMILVTPFSFFSHYLNYTLFTHRLSKYFSLIFAASFTVTLYNYHTQ